MSAGGSVIDYHGARGVVWRIKYRDAGGRQVMETLGRVSDGWNRRKAERALGARLAAVEAGMRKPSRRTFAELADEFERVALPAKPRKASTLVDYRATIRNHLLPHFKDHDIGKLSRDPRAFEEYAGQKITGGLSPKTVRNHLVLLGLMFRTARRWRWVSENPLELVDAPSLPDAETETLQPVEVAALIAAYRELEGDADDSERFWLEAARRMTVLALSTGLRRGELLGLRWQDVSLLERTLSVSQSFVRGEMTTPKSRAGRRTLPLGTVAVGVSGGAVPGVTASGAGISGLLSPGARNPARPFQALGVRAEGTRQGRDLEGVPGVARAPTHGAHRDSRGWRPLHVRSGEGRARPRIHHGAVPPRRPNGVPGSRRPGRGPTLRAR